MSTIAFVADCHLGCPRTLGGPVTAGINRRGQHILDTLRRAVVQAELQEAKFFVVLGDLFDTVRPEPQVMFQCQRILGLARKKGMQVFLLMGNHDQVSDQDGDHALNPLVPVGVQVIAHPCIVRDGSTALWMVPFRPGPAKDWLAKDIAQLAEGDTTSQHRVLCLHLGLSDAQTAPFLQHAQDSIPVATLRRLMTQHRVDWALAGNWHTRREWFDLGCIQVGALCPTGFNNPGHEGLGVVQCYDPNRMPALWTVPIPGPRFVKAEGPAGLEQTVARAPRDCKLYLSWRVQPSQLVEAQAKLATAMEHGFVEDGIVVPDTTAVNEAAQQAALKARGSSTTSAAIDAYVQALELPKGLSAVKVRSRIKHYLKL